MTENHLTDAEIQEYAFQKESCTRTVGEHMAQCGSCKMKAEEYVLLFKIIQEEKKPDFDFNLSELVINQLPVNQLKEPTVSGSFGWAIGIGTIGIILVVFWNTLLSLVWSLTPILTGLIITTVFSLAAFLYIDMYKKHSNKMKALNF